jgi:cyclic beta-1,2-glucan synthetase
MKSLSPEQPALSEAPQSAESARVDAAAYADNVPIRAELHGLGLLEAHARELAALATHTAPGRAGTPLLARLASNERVLLLAYRRIGEAVREGESLSPDAEWLLDNFYIIEEVLREVRHDLPRGYYRQLPELRSGPWAGYPRVYSVALALIAHTDSLLDEAHITCCVEAYQSVTPLTIGELWAVPTMLRLGLIENLRRLAEQMLASWQERAKAEMWVEPLRAAASTSGRSLPPLAMLARPSDALIVRALQITRDAGPPAAFEFLKQQLAAQGIDVADVTRRENQRQAVNQVSVGNCVTSLRLLAAIDWADFFERTNLVDPVLRQDPAGAYAQQDFATRDRYRRAVERLARRSRFTEVEIARRAVELARRAGGNDRAAHVGYYLIDLGVDTLRAQIDYRPGWRDGMLGALLHHPHSGYFGAIILLGVALLGLIVLLGQAAPAWLAILVLAAAFLPVSEIATGVVNYLVTLVVPPRALPKLDFRGRIPTDCATIVVMPSMLVRPQSAAVLAEKLEVHYLANPDPVLRFALLTDFADAPAEHQPEDDEYVQAALDQITELNRRYADGGPSRFFLFHRRRQWNAVEGCWMGWERKRGKLDEFNRLLRGDRTTSYTVLSSDPGELPHIRYVITLDADTVLPRDAAGRLVGAIAHPLNRARFAADAGRVVAGYGVLQPRISFHIPAAHRSLFTRIWAASAGIDPYSTAVSDVYQDLFGAGTFTGKGIYDVDAFAAATVATFPDNHILSHDLIEGNFARCGLVTDIQLFDDFPSRYHVFARREHRWIRGDWQLLPWLGTRVPSRSGPRANPLPLLERWKVFDNLRRSLVPPALVVWLTLGWTVLPIPWWLTTGLALLVLLLPLLLQSSGTIIHVGRCLSLTPLREFCRSGLVTAGQVLLAGVFLLNQALLCVDAIGRTLVRVYFTRRRLLEWETAAAAERRLGHGLRQFWQTMAPTGVAAVALAILVGLYNAPLLPAATLFLAPWLLSPLVAYWVSQPLSIRRKPLSDAERLVLRRIARRTWGFFEAFVGPDDHWLPPDNFQEQPRPQVAHRTSPTNIGLFLLSTQAAHDFGYIGLRTLLERLERTFATLDRLDRWYGHLFNWYDTRTLQPLQPAYISTVDSGNLLGCLIALKQALYEKASEPAAGQAVLGGCVDTLQLAAEAIRAGHERHADDALKAFERFLGEDPPDGTQGWPARLARACEHADRLRSAVQSHVVTQDDPRAVWTGRLAAMLREHAAERAQAWEPEAQARQSLSLASASGSQRDALAGASGTNDFLARIHLLAARADELARGMDFRLLYKPERHLFAIGYHVPDARLDSACYDLLASEARLSSFLAIARGDAPHKHWFHLGRLLVSVDHRLCLVSWGGTMFEYLMPDLLLRRYPETLLSESDQAAVERQIEYARERGVPWGISESAYSSQYLNLDYQYQAFGVPGLGLKRGLSEDLVVAPYATALATMVRPHEAVHNLRRLAAEGAEGPYGHYEAIDYTRRRLPEGKRSLVVRCYMAHHQGMSLLALANCLLGDPWPRRLHAEASVRATDLLLQERVPVGVSPLLPPDQDGVPSHATAEVSTALSRRLTTPQTAEPRTHLLSNGRYSVMVTNAGGGYSRCGVLDVTRWREDSTTDDTGMFLYVRDLTTDLLWSTGHQPIRRPSDHYEVIYSADKAEFRRVDGQVVTHLEITVCPENCAELRRLTFTNHDRRPHDLEVTTYAELVLGPHAADLAHPAFGKLFLETEWSAEHAALLCRRRPRAVGEREDWAVHLAGGDTHGESTHGANIHCETDRARFLGRGRTPADPAALAPGAELSGTTGAVLDPIFSLRRRVRVAPGAAVTITFCLAVAESRAQALALADHYRDAQAVHRVFDLAWAHSQIELRHLRISTEDAHLYQRLAEHLLYSGPALRAAPEVLRANQQGVSALWRYGISGDRPIVLVRCGEAEEVPLVRQLLVAHAYLRMKGLEVDLVIVCEEATGYNEPLCQELQQAIRGSESHALADRPGGIFLCKSGQIPAEDRQLLLAAARVVLDGSRGSLKAQLSRPEVAPATPAVAPGGRQSGSAQDRKADPASTVRLPDDLLFANGLGGFTPDGREYCILPYTAGKPTPPPAPWINVIANPVCGCIVSDSGLGCTWTGNSQLNRLTPWWNDPASDPPAEVVYLRDDATGEMWTPTPRPLGAIPTLVRHGQGYTVFEQQGRGLAQELIVTVAPADPVKLIVLRLRNTGGQARRLSATYYAAWVLGTVRDQAAANLRTEVDPEHGALLADNPFSADFAGEVAFADVNVRPRTLLADRTAFLGRNGSITAPAALQQTGLSGRVGPGLDPCAALQVAFELAPGAAKEIVFLLGSAPSADTARNLLTQYKQPGRAAMVLTEVREFWDRTLGAIDMQTPDPAFNLLVNRWLPYQVLSCRLWGRTAFYQSSGAYGFRDQLQDVMALVYGAPGEARAHLLRAASRQFVEGDVQHWWHPPSGRGIRTRCSDDYLWLPFAVHHYVTITGDAAVLDEMVPWLRAPRLRPDQEDEYGLPETADVSGTLYEHCVRALENGLHFGVHGLPLMGTGDWNDGMNRVGAGGKGETVWGAWFLLTCLDRFATLAESRGETAHASAWRAETERLRNAIDEHAWDGAWYRRAYCDDGTPLGSTSNPECQIDSIAQSWAVMSGAADRDRAVQAMHAVYERLVQRDHRLILLLAPPFDTSPLEPGYIKGYVPGIRENGGQYTHAATWVVQAAALLGDANRALELFHLLNPIYQADSPDAVNHYCIEPYVVAGDVYGAPPHIGRGGWSWYTGAAGWLYRVAVETLLGLRLHGDHLTLAPCMPEHWTSFTLTVCRGATVYRIAVERGAPEVLLDGGPCAGDAIPWLGDGNAHSVRVVV